MPQQQKNIFSLQVDLQVKHQLYQQEMYIDHFTTCALRRRVRKPQINKGGWTLSLPTKPLLFLFWFEKFSDFPRRRQKFFSGISGFPRKFLPAASYFSTSYFNSFPPFYKLGSTCSSDLQENTLNCKVVDK